MRFYFQTKKDAQEYWAHLVEEQRYIPMAPIEERMADARYRLKVRRSDGTWTELEGRRNRPVFTFLTREAGRNAAASGTLENRTGGILQYDDADAVHPFDSAIARPAVIDVGDSSLALNYFDFFNTVTGARQPYLNHIQLVQWRPLDAVAVADIVSRITHRGLAITEAARRQAAAMGIYASLHNIGGIEIIADPRWEELMNVIPVPVTAATGDTQTYLHTPETILTSLHAFRTVSRIPVQFQGFTLPPQFRDFIASQIREASRAGERVMFYLAFSTDLYRLNLVKVTLP